MIASGLDFMSHPGLINEMLEDRRAVLFETQSHRVFGSSHGRLFLIALLRMLISAGSLVGRAEQLHLLNFCTVSNLH